MFGPHYCGEITERDNLLVHTSNNVYRDDLTAGYRQGLGFESVARLLVMCSSNLRFLEFEMPPFDITQENAELAGLLDRIKRMVHKFNLPNLRHLSLKNTSTGRIPEDCVSDIIKELPLLESLSCNRLMRSRMEPSDSAHPFKWHLAQLSRLSKLELSQCDNIDETWALESWPRTITSLRLVQCNRLTLGQAFKLIESFAPNLKQLELDLAIRSLPSAPHSAPPSFPPIKLPELTSFSINGQQESCNPLTSFLESKRLRHLEYMSCPQDLVGTLCQLVCASTWPHLTTVHLDHEKWDTDSNWDMWLDLERMRTFCEERNIGIKVENFETF